MVPASAIQASPVEMESAKDATQSLLATSIGFIVLNTVFFVARFYTSVFLRPSKSRTLWWDDWLTIPAYLSNIGLIICALQMRSIYINSEPPLTAHEWVNPYVNPELYPTLVDLLKVIYALTNLLVPVFVFTRLSIIALFLRIFNGRAVRISCYILGALIFIQWISCQLVALLLCRPVHTFWDRKLHGKCIDGNAYYRGISYPTLVLDVGLIVLPLPSVWRLKMSAMRRTAITALFLTSVLAFIASAYRTSIVQSHDANHLTPADSNLWISWMVGETGIYLIVACLPTLTPLFRMLIPSRLRGSPDSHNNNGHTRYTSRISRSPREHFARLVEHDTHSRAVASPAETRKGARMTPSEIELCERAITPGGGPKVDDLLGMRAGRGVLVHTEIIITEEEKVKDVIGI